MAKLTSLESLNLLQSSRLLLLPLLQLLHLDLLSELLEISLFPRLSRGLLRCSSLNKLRLDLRHVLVSLDHLRKVVGRTGEWLLLLLEECTRLLNGGERLLVELELAGQVIGDVLDYDWGGGGDGLMVDELEALKWEGDTAECGSKGGGVVNRQSLMWNHILLILIIQILKVTEWDILIIAIQSIAIRNTRGRCAVGIVNVGEVDLCALLLLVGLLVLLHSHELSQSLLILLLGVLLCVVHLDVLLDWGWSLLLVLLACLLGELLLVLLLEVDLLLGDERHLQFALVDHFCGVVG